MSLRRAQALALSVASGLLLLVSSEPFGASPVAWVALAPLFLACLRARGARWGAVWGFVAGLVYFGPHLWWIFLFGWMAWSGLVVTMSLYWAVAGALVTFFRRFPLAPVLGAASWAAVELARDSLPFGGFGWGAVGTSQGAVPGVRWLAGVVGTSGLTFLIAFAAAVVADRIFARKLAVGSMALVAAVLALFVAADVSRFRPPPGRPFRIAAVQGNVPRPVRLDQDRAIFVNHLRLTQRIVDRPPDVVVWPESAYGPGAGDEGDDVLRRLARILGTHMLVGRTEISHGRSQFLNLVDLIAPSGDRKATYQKRHPVPFGEHVPLPFLRRYVSTLGQVPYDMVPGRRWTVFDVGGTKVGVPICFESAFARDARAFARAGAEVLVVATNDSSFERSYSSRQHLAHSRMRALELRMWVVQAALSGVSGVISPDGTVSQRTRLFTQAVVRTEVRARPATSLYARTGDLFVGGWAAGAAFALLLYVLVLVAGRRR